MAYRRSLQHRLVAYVSVGLLILSLISGIVIYHQTYERELHNAASLEQQLVGTVQNQAEVAVFATNIAIAEGVVEGLRANPNVLTVRIVGEGGLTLNAGNSVRGVETTITNYPLYSPVDGTTRIGLLSIARNDALIRAEAAMHSLRQAAMLLLLIAAAAALIMLFSRHLIGRPVSELADRLAAIQPGSGERLPLPLAHADDEIGSLTDSANALIHAAEEALAEARALAVTDALTGLPNRRAFMTHLGNEFERHKRYALPPASVLMLDIDHFKQVNDRHGHAAGDAVLHRFGTLLADELRKVDCAGRIGGEEFAALLPGTDITAATVFSERLRAKVAETRIPCAGIETYITVSIGIAVIDSADLRPEDALARADAALYRAKHEGRNRVVAA